MSNIAIFCVNLTFNIIVLWVDESSNFIMAKPEISTKNGTSIFISFCSFGFNTVFPSEIWVLIYLSFSLFPTVLWDKKTVQVASKYKTR